MGTWASHGSMAELVDAADLKSADGNVVGVQVPLLPSSLQSAGLLGRPQAVALLHAALGRSCSGWRHGSSSWLDQRSGRVGCPGRSADGSCQCGHGAGSGGGTAAGLVDHITGLKPSRAAARPSRSQVESAPAFCVASNQAPRPVWWLGCLVAASAGQMGPSWWKAHHLQRHRQQATLAGGQMFYR